MPRRFSLATCLSLLPLVEFITTNTHIADMKQSKLCSTGFCPFHFYLHFSLAFHSTCTDFISMWGISLFFLWLLILFGCNCQKHIFSLLGHPISWKRTQYLWWCWNYADGMKPFQRCTWCHAEKKRNLFCRALFFISLNKSHLPFHHSGLIKRNMHIQQDQQEWLTCSNNNNYNNIKIYIL